VVDVTPESEASRVLFPFGCCRSTSLGLDPAGPSWSNVNCRLTAYGASTEENTGRANAKESGHG
jgi:hypothetical protein